MLAIAAAGWAELRRGRWLDRSGEGARAALRDSLGPDIRARVGVVSLRRGRATPETAAGRRGGSVPPTWLWSRNSSQAETAWGSAGGPGPSCQCLLAQLHEGALPGGRTGRRVPPRRPPAARRPRGARGTPRPTSRRSGRTRWLDPDRQGIVRRGPDRDRPGKLGSAGLDPTGLRGVAEIASHPCPPSRQAPARRGRPDLGEGRKNGRGRPRLRPSDVALPRRSFGPALLDPLGPAGRGSWATLPACPQSAGGRRAGSAPDPGENVEARPSSGPGTCAAMGGRDLEVSWWSIVRWPRTRPAFLRRVEPGGRSPRLGALASSSGPSAPWNTRRSGGRPWKYI